MRSSCRFGIAAVLLGCLALTLGCSSGPKLYPVSGKVTAGKTTLAGGQVTFVPDESKGNKTKTSPTGQIGSDGTYSLKTDGRDGAPAGWYKVTVNTDIPGSPPSGVKIDPIYSDPARTLLNIEVVADSSAKYDVKIP